MAWVLKMDDAAIESGLVHDFDASLSGIGQELGAGAYSMRLETHHTHLSFVAELCVARERKRNTLRLDVLMPLPSVYSHCFGVYRRTDTAEYHRDQGFISLV